MNKSTAASLDRKILLALIGLLAGFFIAMLMGAREFMPDARLYPFVMSMLGIALAFFAAVRVFAGKEPREEHKRMGPGTNAETKQDEPSRENILRPYQGAAYYLLGLCLFYTGIGLLGFRLATVVFVFSFMRYNKQSLIACAIYGALGLLLVESLSRLLGLVLPAGLWLSLF